MWTDPQTVTALIVAIAGLLSAITALARVFHNTSRITGLEDREVTRHPQA
jgi:hypothetical protein